MWPFCVLLHPQINKLLTHSVPTGYTRLGTLMQHRPQHKLPNKKNAQTRLEATATADAPSKHVETEQDDSQGTSAGESSSRSSQTGANSKSLDPVKDLKKVVRRLPGGSIALRSCDLGLRIAGSAVNATLAITSLQVRVASVAVSLGYRAADAGVTNVLNMAYYIPGSGLAVSVGNGAFGCAQKLTTAACAGSAYVVRQIPGGSTALSICEEALYTVGFMAQQMESPGLSQDGEPSLPLLQAGTEHAEVLKKEAAARLTTLLEQAEQLEQLAEKETAEAMERLRPEINKIAVALQAQPPRLLAKVRRTHAACDALVQSLWVCSRSIARQVLTAGTTLLRSFHREWKDVRANAPGREPGMLPMLQAYSMVVFSSACEAVLEFQSGMRKQSYYNVPELTRSASAPASMQSGVWVDSLFCGLSSPRTSESLAPHYPGRHRRGSRY